MSVRPYARVPRTDPEWIDPIRPGWPGPQSAWTEEMRAVFEHAEMLALEHGEHRARAFAHGYGAVTRMRRGRA